MSITALIKATESLKKREGDLLPTLKAVFFEQLKNRYPPKKIKDVLLEQKGGSWGNDFFQGSINAKVLRSPDIRFGFIDFDNAEERYFTKKEIENFNLVNNDILVIKSNGSLDLVGKSQIYKENNRFPHVVASNFLMVLRPNEGIIYPEYLDLFLKSPESLVWRFDTQKTTTGLRNLNTSGFLNIEVPVPATIKEQQRLFKTFGDCVTGKINENETEIRRFYFLATQKETLATELSSQDNLLSQLRQSFLREGMQGKLVKQDPKDGHAKDLLEKIKAEKARSGRKEKELPPIKSEELPFEIPENWVWCRLGEIISENQGGLERNKLEQSLDYPTPYFKMNDILDFGVANMENLVRIKASDAEIAKYKLSKGDFLFNTRNSKELVGKTCLIDKEPREITLYNNNIVRLKLLANPAFINYYFCTSVNKNYLLGLVSATTNVAAIYLGQMINIPIPFPPTCEQVRIVKKLDELMRLCEGLQESIQATREQNELLLQQVLKEALLKNS